MPVVEGLDEAAHVDAARVGGDARRERDVSRRSDAAPVGEVDRDRVAEVGDSGLVKERVAIAGASAWTSGSSTRIESGE